MLLLMKHIHQLAFQTFFCLRKQSTLSVSIVNRVSFEKILLLLCWRNMLV